MVVKPIYKTTVLLLGRPRYRLLSALKVQQIRSGYGRQLLYAKLA